MLRLCLLERLLTRATPLWLVYPTGRFSRTIGTPGASGERNTTYQLEVGGVKKISLSANVMASAAVVRVVLL